MASADDLGHTQLPDFISRGSEAEEALLLNLLIYETDWLRELKEIM